MGKRSDNVTKGIKRAPMLLKQSGYLIGGHANSLSSELTLSKRWGGWLSVSYNLAADYS